MDTLKNKIKANILSLLNVCDSCFHCTLVLITCIYIISAAADILVDGRYKHSEFVQVHLDFLASLAQDGGIYLPLKRAIEVWDTLVTNQHSCHGDREVRFC